MCEKIIPQTISFSGLSDFHYCSHYYKLVDLQKLKPWKNTPSTIFGTCVHHYVQSILEETITIEKACQEFERKWNKLYKLYKLEDKWLESAQAGKNIFLNILPVFQNQFGKFKVLNIERKLFTTTGDKYTQQFKGFVDIILELENGDRIIADFKTADSAFFFVKYKETVKDYQLALYKHFYCKEENFDRKKLETYFVILEKNPKSKKPVSMLRITSGDKKLDNAINWMNGVLSCINRGLFLKNRKNCFKYGENNACCFYDTPLCPKTFG